MREPAAHMWGFCHRHHGRGQNRTASAQCVRWDEGKFGPGGGSEIRVEMIVETSGSGSECEEFFEKVL